MRYVDLYGLETVALTETTTASRCEIIIWVLRRTHDQDAAQLDRKISLELCDVGGLLIGVQAGR